MLVHSDWHIHSEASYDATLPLSVIYDNARLWGFHTVGVTDHVNSNEENYLSDLRRSAELVGAFPAEEPRILLGVELTPIERPLFDYIRTHGTREGYVAPATTFPYGIELAVTRDHLVALGVRYAVGAAHWRVDVPSEARSDADINAVIREWYRQQMYLACDERVTILGHPWYHGKGLWYEDLSVIPHSMQADLAAALKENGKYVECNSHFFTTPKASEKFRRQYAELLRELFEAGVPVTYGSDAHNTYKCVHENAEPYLLAAGFRDGDLVALSEDALW